MELEPKNGSAKGRTGIVGYLLRIFLVLAIVVILAWPMIIISNNLRSCAASLGSGANAISHVADVGAGLFKPNVDSKTMILSNVARLQDTSKLVVKVADIDVEVNKSETYTWLRGWVYLGTTVAKVRAKGCKAQYVVPLGNFSKSDIETVETANQDRIFRIWFPHPTVDEGIVEVNYDNLDVYAQSAWARFNKNDVAEDAKKGLKEVVLAQAKNELYIHEAEEAAEKDLRVILDPLAESIQPGVKFEIKFR